MNIKIISALVFLTALNLFPQSENNLRMMVGSAYLENKSYNMLERLCDEAGGRILGSVVNEKAMSIMKDELKKLVMMQSLKNFQFMVGLEETIK